MCLSCEWEFNKVLLEAHAKFQTNPHGYARVMAHGPSPWFVCQLEPELAFWSKFASAKAAHVLFLVPL